MPCLFLGQYFGDEVPVSWIEFSDTGNGLVVGSRCDLRVEAKKEGANSTRTPIPKASGLLE